MTIEKYKKENYHCFPVDPSDTIYLIYHQSEEEEEEDGRMNQNRENNEIKEVSVKEESSDSILLTIEGQRSRKYKILTSSQKDFLINLVKIYLS